MKNKKIKIGIALLLIAGALWFLVGYVSAWHLTSRRLGAWKAALPFSKENINLKSEDGINISSWYIKGNTDKAIIILSGIGSDRHGSISRAKFYIEKGYTVLLPDLRATGKSGGNVISFGWHEAKDLKACYQYLKEKGFNKISAHGCSLGAATIIYSMKDIRDYHFIVLESCYDNLDNAFANRVNKYHLPEFSYFPVRFFVEKRMNTDIKELNPEEYIKLGNCPILIMAGDSELQLKLEETKKIFNNCPYKEKNIYIFKNGKHEDFKIKFPIEYDKALNGFIDKY